jgi:hypothetical protein
MGVGPLIAGVGFLLMTRLGANLDYWTQLLPAAVVFGLGLSITVAPLTAAILGDVPPAQAGIASAVNNAVARIAGLLAVAAVGAIVAAQFSSVLDNYAKQWRLDPVSVAMAKQAPLQITPPKPYQDDKFYKLFLQDSSVSAFRAGMETIAGLVIAGGVISLVDIRNPAKK